METRSKCEVSQGQRCMTVLHTCQRIVCELSRTETEWRPASKEGRANKEESSKGPTTFGISLLTHFLCRDPGKKLTQSNLVVLYAHEWASSYRTNTFFWNRAWEQDTSFSLTVHSWNTSILRASSHSHGYKTHKV